MGNGKWRWQQQISCGPLKRNHQSDHLLARDQHYLCNTSRGCIIAINHQRTINSFSSFYSTPNQLKQTHLRQWIHGPSTVHTANGITRRRGNKERPPKLSTDNACRDDIRERMFYDAKNITRGKRNVEGQYQVRGDPTRTVMESAPALSTDSDAKCRLEITCKYLKGQPQRIHVCPGCTQKRGEDSQALTVQVPIRQHK